MHPRGIIRQQLKKVSELWDSMFNNIISMFKPQDAVYEEIQDILPYYVLIEMEPNFKDIPFDPANGLKYTRRIAFVAADSSMEDLEWYMLDTLNMLAIKEHVLEIRPKLEVIKGIPYLRVPLIEGDMTNNQKEVNNYLHNLMYWESQLDTNSVGPFALRYLWVLEKLYTQKLELNDMRNSFMEYGINTDIHKGDMVRTVRDLCRRNQMVNEQIHLMAGSINEARNAVKAEERMQVMQKVDEMNQMSRLLAHSIERNAMMHDQLNNLLMHLREDEESLCMMQKNWESKTEEVTELLKQLIAKR